MVKNSTMGKLRMVKAMTGRAIPRIRLLKVIYVLIPLPVPNWASAEEQFIPNYPPQITIYSKFFFENPNFSLSTKFFLLDLSVGVLNRK